MDSAKKFVGSTFFISTPSNRRTKSLGFGLNRNVQTNIKKAVDSLSPGHSIVLAKTRRGVHLKLRRSSSRDTSGSKVQMVHTYQDSLEKLSCLTRIVRELSEDDDLNVALLTEDDASTISSFFYASEEGFSRAEGGTPNPTSGKGRPPLIPIDNQAGFVQAFQEVVQRNREQEAILMRRENGHIKRFHPNGNPVDDA